MSAIYLLVKRHRETGLLYFCKTTKENYLKYNGSGLYWKHHLNKHGKNVDTIKVWKFEDPSKAERFALRFSSFYDIVQSEAWANMQVENALDGAPSGHENWCIEHTKETKEKIRQSKVGKPRPESVMNALQEGRRNRKPTQEELARRSASVSKLRWYNNGQTSIRLKPSEPIPEGFVPGRSKVKF